MDHLIPHEKVGKNPCGCKIPHETVEFLRPAKRQGISTGEISASLRNFRQFLSTPQVVRESHFPLHGEGHFLWLAKATRRHTTFFEWKGTRKRISLQKVHLPFVNKYWKKTFIHSAFHQVLWYQNVLMSNSGKFRSMILPTFSVNSS